MDTKIPTVRIDDGRTAAAASNGRGVPIAGSHNLRDLGGYETIDGRKIAEQRWRSLVGQDPSTEAWSRFDAFMDECAFGNMLKAVNGDANHPRVVRLVMPPHEWFGMHVPGSTNTSICRSARKAVRPWRITCGAIPGPHAPRTRLMRRREPRSTATGPPSSAIRTISAYRTSPESEDAS